MGSWVGQSHTHGRFRLSPLGAEEDEIRIPADSQHRGFGQVRIDRFCLKNCGETALDSG